MEFVQVHEVGPRDGLQNEAGVISVDRKVALVRALVDAGFRRIEVGSFVSPKWVPQMADTDRVMAALSAVPGVRYDVLVPNMRGWDGFLAAPRLGDYGVAVFISASEGFSRANLNCTIAESVARLAPVVQAAAALAVPVRGYVSCVSDCPFDGPVAPAAVAQAVALLRAVAPMPVSLGDTLGRATPARIAAMLAAVAEVAPVAELAGHYHDTSGRALENVAVSLEMGLRAFDSAAGGLGGCPYAPGAPGNLASEALVPFLHDNGYKTGVDATKLAEAAALAKEIRNGNTAH
jgi:hydroxymethylglutaryl-CoA lyase